GERAATRCVFRWRTCSDGHRRSSSSRRAARISTRRRSREGRSSATRGGRRFPRSKPATSSRSTRVASSRGPLSASSMESRCLRISFIRSEWRSEFPAVGDGFNCNPVRLLSSRGALSCHLEEHKRRRDEGSAFCRSDRRKLLITPASTVQRGNCRGHWPTPCAEPQKSADDPLKKVVERSFVVLRAVTACVRGSFRAKQLVPV